MSPPPDAVVALLAQWARIAAQVPALDLDEPTRLPGWRNREVLAHLTLHATQAARYLAGPEPVRPSMTLNDHLLGTTSFAGVVDRTARENAVEGRMDLGAAAKAVADEFQQADPFRVVITVLGSIRLNDYAVTRCVEAVVHGLDLVPAVAPEPRAAEITAEAMDALLRRRAPQAGRPADPVTWIEIAAGRRQAPEEFPELPAVCPLIS